MTFQPQDNKEENHTGETRQTAGIVLAAGGSERLGRPKQLCAWQDVPFVLQVVQNAVEGGLSPLKVVVGAYRELIEKTLRAFPVQIVRNPDWASGIGSSMKAGLLALPKTCESIMFLLSDQPQISPTMIHQLIEHYIHYHAPITAPKVGNRWTNPVLFDKSTFQALMQVKGDKGGRAVFDQFEGNWLPWIDDRALMDVDKAEDEQALLDAFFPLRS